MCGSWSSSRNRAGNVRTILSSSEVATGLAELTEWLSDQVRVGLAASPGGADAIAARMVDAQAPGIASVLRGLSVLPWSAGDEWPGRVLGEYARRGGVIYGRQATP